MFTAPTLAGALFSAAWWLFFDAIVVQGRFQRVPEPRVVDWAPGMLATVAAAFMAAIPSKQLHDELSGTQSLGSIGGRRRCATCLLFVAFSTALVSVTAAVGMAQVRYIDGVSPLVRETAQYSAWPGTAAFLQAILIVGAACILVVHRISAHQINDDAV